MLKPKAPYSQSKAQGSSCQFRGKNGAPLSPSDFLLPSLELTVWRPVFRGYVSSREGKLAIPFRKFRGHTHTHTHSLIHSKTSIKKKRNKHVLAGVALRNETKCPWDHHWSNPPFGSSRLMLTQSLDSWSNKRFGESFPKFPQFVRSWGIIIITIHWSIATFIFQLQQISSAAYFDGTPGAVRRPLTAF